MTDTIRYNYTLKYDDRKLTEKVFCQFSDFGQFSVTLKIDLIKYNTD